MKNTLKIIGISILLFLLLGISNKVMASNATISATKTTCEVGDEVSINVSISGAASTNLTVGVINEKIVEYSDDGNNTNFSKNYKLDTSSSGSKTITLTGDITDENFQKKNINTSVTVKINEKQKKEEENETSQNKTSNNNTPSTTTETKKIVKCKPIKFRNYPKRF